MFLTMIRISLLVFSLFVAVEGFEQFKTKQELVDAVDQYLGGDHGEAVKEKYGNPMNNWNVKLIQDFSELFSAERNGKINDVKFSEKLDDWDTRNAKNMKKMFYKAKHFNGLISEWDVSKVTDMSNMFAGCELFNGNLENWDVQSVKHMEYMFANVEGQGRFSFNSNIGTWDTSSVWSMKGMFRGSRKFNQDLNDWDTSSLTSTKAMFQNAIVFDGNIGNWNVSGVKDMHQMFHGATSYTGKGIEKWDTSKVTEFDGMFAFTKSFSADISGWDVSNAMTATGMFMGAEGFTTDVSGWDVGKITAMENMFKDANSFSHDLCPWAYTVRRNAEGDDPVTVDVHGMFKNTSCAEHLDPIIDNKLSRGFCVSKCKKEKKKGGIGTIILYAVGFSIAAIGGIFLVRKVIFNPHRGMKELGGNDSPPPSFFGANADAANTDNKKPNIV